MTASEQPEAQLRIGELARCAGVTSRAIRHYHATGLLPEPPRDASGYRRYGPSDLVRLVHICRLRALGMPIDQIGKVLEETPDAGADLPAALLALAVDVDAEIDRLRGVHDRLITLAESDDLDDAADLLTAGLRARGLLDPDPRATGSPEQPSPRGRGRLRRRARARGQRHGHGPVPGGPPAQPPASTTCSSGSVRSARTRSSSWPRSSRASSRRHGTRPSRSTCR